ncbi:MAG: HAD family hydrolase [Candidatus Gastranaerophilaceae bacterium]
MKIFFDLDGTILDASDRLYCLFCDLIPECKFSKDEYWQLKRNKVNHKMILEKYFPEYDFETFNTRWLELIETDKYLSLDKIYIGVYELLEKLQKNNEIYLLTARQSKEKLFEELERLNLEKYFNEILVTENKKTKKDLLEMLNLNDNDIFITDMGKDVQTAQSAGIRSVAVTYGFMCREKIKEYEPTYIRDSIEEIGEYYDKVFGFRKN